MDIKLNRSFYGHLHIIVDKLYKNSINTKFLAVLLFLTLIGTLWGSPAAVVVRQGAIEKTNCKIVLIIIIIDLNSSVLLDMTSLTYSSPSSRWDRGRSQHSPSRSVIIAAYHSLSNCMQVGKAKRK